MTLESANWAKAKYNRQNNTGKALKKLNQKIGFSDKMDSFSDGWYHKNLIVEHSLSQVDENAYQFTIDLINKLKLHSQKHKLFFTKRHLLATMQTIFV